MSKLACTWAELTGWKSHLARCPRCARRSRFDRAIAEVAVPPARTPVPDHVFQRAFAMRARPTPIARWPVALALAAAAGVALAVWAASSRGGEPDREVAGVDVPVGATLAADATTRVAHAQIAVAAGAVVSRTDELEIRLDHGSVSVDVDPAPHRPFRVVTARFAVEVLGTAFTVSDDGVRVDRGAVRVVSTSGEVLAARVGAGEAWSADATTAGREERPNAGQPAPDRDVHILQGSRPPTPTPSLKAPTPRAPPPPRPPTPAPVPTPAPSTATIAAARSQLARGDVDAARATITTLLAASPGPELRADAEELMAESYLQSDPAEAQRRSEAVANTYRSTVTGEAALGVAIRAARMSKHGDDERRLLATYLERYPNGALHARVRARLDALGGGR